MFLRHWKTLLALLLHITSCFSVPLGEFYPYGVDQGDSVVPRDDDNSSGEIRISVLFPYFDRNHDSLYVSDFFLYSLFFPDFSRSSWNIPCRYLLSANCGINLFRA